MLSEVGVIVVLLTTLAAYRVLIAPAMTDAEYEALGPQLGFYIAPAAGATMTFLMALWVARRLDRGSSPTACGSGS